MMRRVKHHNSAITVGLLMLAAIGATAAGATPVRPLASNTASPAQTADATARAFYVWYVGLMAHDKEPSDDPASYARFVSRGLRAQIERKMNSADGMDVDYFIKAQDYLDEWLGHVAVTAPTMRGTMARSVVTLGGGAKPWRLAVSLAREGSRWKIAGVTKA